ncbi:MAG: DUF1883 domain-containing protein [Acidimicrobiales bacterium]|nr:DUF1883 domain-containing protein [Acidimicrobiales bacterium]GJM39401.1 MAG: hypothetical protein DHS20C19_27680 [Acidimicrobiales bacterium]
MGKFIYQDLGQRSRGDVVEVTLTKGANVRLMDPANYRSFQRGEKHRFVGGLAKKSPVRLEIPSSGHWYVTVDTQGLRNGTQASFRIIKASALRPLSPIRDRRQQLAELVDNAADVGPGGGGREFDVFVSHAAEDKETVVRPLAHALQERGLSVWYDEFELRIGDSLRRKIDSGIARSRFGLVVLSKSFFAKGWPQYELDGLVTMAVGGKQVLLPIWHEISKDEVIDRSPSLADKVALRTADYGVDEIADEVAAVILNSAIGSGDPA